MCTSARPWRFKSIGSRSGRAVSSIQMMRPRYFVSPICDAIMPNTRLDVPESPSCSRPPSAASASSTTTTTGPIARRTESTRSRLPFRLADVLRPEVLQHHAGRADLAADALGEKRFPGPDRPADQIAHRQAVERSALEQRGVLAQPGLGRFVSDDGVERPLRLDELEQTVALPLDQQLLQLAEHFRVEPSSAFARRLHDDVEVGERDACGQRRQLRGVVVREPGERRGVHGGVDESHALRLGG